MQGKIASVIKTLEKQDVLTPSLNETICNIKDLDELEFCVCIGFIRNLHCQHYKFLKNELQYAPFKDSKKKTLAAKAKELGLEEPAMKLLFETSNHVALGYLINVEVEGLESIKIVELGIQYVIADIIGKNKENVDKMNDL